MIRVVRVGGSLLTWKSFVPAFTSWLDNQPQARNVLIAGGGPWVELLRQAADRFDLDEESAHWLSIRAMSTTAQLLSTLVAADVISDFDELVVCQRRQVVFDVEAFLRSINSGHDTSLPATWNVTSDSISALVAARLHAEELVLLKSRDTPSPGQPTAELAKVGYVDSFFPAASSGIAKLRYVNLRKTRNWESGSNDCAGST
jgi:aspartokinase-like uncharacterized kinase